MNNHFLNPKHFIPTKAFLRFEEFAQSCTQFNYIGLCYGKPGVGKTIAAQYYAKWHNIHHAHQIEELDKETKQTIDKCKAVFYTAQITDTPKQISQQIYREISRYGTAYLRAKGKTDWIELLIEQKASQHV